jgi:hypothetical protein
LAAFFAQRWDQAIDPVLLASNLIIRPRPTGSPRPAATSS